jgi:hypothetical protein
MPNPPLSALSTLSQLATPVRELVLANRTANATVRNNTSVARFPSSTQPVTDTANGSIVFNSEGLNYMRLCPVVQHSTGGNTYTSTSMRVTGWNYDQPNNLWVPMPIADVTMTIGTNNFALTQIAATPNFRQATGFTLNSGDAKIYPSASAAENGGWMCVDTWGCQRIELEFRGTSVVGSPVANCFFMSA